MPRSFKDSQGRTWIIDVPFGAIQRVLTVTGIDLRHLRDEGSAVAMELDDPEKMKAVLAVLTEDQRKELNNLSINDVMNSLRTEQQSDAAVLAVYQATFDFFHSLGEELNDALSRTIGALERARTQTKRRMRRFLDSGNMDTLLAILTDPEQLGQWLMAAQDATANPEIAKAMADATALETDSAKLPTVFIRLCVERKLSLKPSAESAMPKSGDSPESSEKTPARLTGDSST